MRRVAAAGQAEIVIVAGCLAAAAAGFLGNGAMGKAKEAPTRCMIARLVTFPDLTAFLQRPKGGSLFASIVTSPPHQRLSPAALPNQGAIGVFVERTANSCSLNQWLGCNCPQTLALVWAGRWALGAGRWAQSFFITTVTSVLGPGKPSRSIVSLRCLVTTASPELLVSTGVSRSHARGLIHSSFNAPNVSLSEDCSPECAIVAQHTSTLV
ncbi:hypothetical protein LA080_005958 [Diaporthe eres]|nr:hypothetical protein LA080_005958 [Diaporthe eres]